MTEYDYVYAVARIRSRELDLFDEPVIRQLLASKSYDECVKILLDKGWGKPESITGEQILAAEREKTWSLIEELVEDMSVFNTLILENDFHNLKAAIKQVYIGSKLQNIYLKPGTIDPETIFKAASEHEFSLLPDYMQECAEDAYRVQMHTGDSQLCDVIIDKAALEAIQKKAEESSDPLLVKYAELKTAGADIKIALRGSKAGKSREFLERALAECKTLDIKELAERALQGENAILEYLQTTDYSDVVAIIRKSPLAFERWLDNLVMKLIRPQKYNAFSLSPLAAYVLARENEIKTVRIILSGKLNKLSEDSIRERLREMYV
jgi:V/A-type H+-transporting ATPase subunit C